VGTTTVVENVRSRSGLRNRQSSAATASARARCSADRRPRARRAGEIRLDQVDISAKPTYQRSDCGLGYVPQEREVFPSLTVRENLSVALRPGAWNEERLFGVFPGLAARMNSLGWQLSGGEQQMLSIARALMGNPKVLLMDEPTEGLAPVVVEQLVAALRGVTADSSLAVLLVEQRVDVVLEMSSRC
jgi:branched-chain amino acid transport system ATP-binding protein